MLLAALVVVCFLHKKRNICLAWVKLVFFDRPIRAGFTRRLTNAVIALESVMSKIANTHFRDTIGVLFSCDVELFDNFLVKCAIPLSGRSYRGVCTIFAHGVWIWACATIFTLTSSVLGAFRSASFEPFVTIVPLPNHLFGVSVCYGSIQLHKWNVWTRRVHVLIKLVDSNSWTEVETSVVVLR